MATVKLSCSSRSFALIFAVGEVTFRLTKEKLFNFYLYTSALLSIAMGVVLRMLGCFVNMTTANGG